VTKLQIRGSSPVATIYLAAAANGESNQLSAVRIGYQKYGTLNVSKQRAFEKSLTDKGVKVLGSFHGGRS